MSVDQAVFYALAALVLGAGFLTVRSSNLVHAAFWMMPCFLGVACLFLCLQNELLFVVQLIIYAGAIPITVLFVLMLTREVMSEGRREYNRLWPLGALTAMAFLAVALVQVKSVPEPAALAVPPGDLTRAIGEGFLTSYLLPFELASMLLLASMVGAIYLARADRKRPLPLPPTVCDPAAPTPEPAGQEVGVV